MRLKKNLSHDLRDFERYLATQQVIKPQEVKRILNELISKAELLETKTN